MQIEKGKTEQEISPELVREIEASDFNILSKVDFLLVMAGLKPGSEMMSDVEENEEGRLVGKIKTQEQFQKNISIIEKSRIPHREFIGPKGLSGVILIGHTQDDLEAINLAYGRNYILAPKTKEDHQMRGRAYGFPPSAVEAYSNFGAEGMLDESQLSAEDQEKYRDALAFKTHALSREHWREELEQGQSYANFIKKISPILYNERLEWFKKVLRDRDKLKNKTVYK